MSEVEARGTDFLAVVIENKLIRMRTLVNHLLHFVALVIHVAVDKILIEGVAFFDLALFVFSETSTLI